LDHAADLEEKVIYGYVTGKGSYDFNSTALYPACTIGRKGTADYLLERGADTDGMNVTRRTYKQAAKARGLKNAVELFKKRVQRNEHGENHCPVR
jgi:hypothetical protein